MRRTATTRLRTAPADASSCCQSPAAARCAPGFRQTDSDFWKVPPVGRDRVQKERRGERTGQVRMNPREQLSQTLSTLREGGGLLTKLFHDPEPNSPKTGTVTLGLAFCSREAHKAPAFVHCGRAIHHPHLHHCLSQASDAYLRPAVAPGKKGHLVLFIWLRVCRNTLTDVKDDPNQSSKQPPRP